MEQHPKALPDHADIVVSSSENDVTIEVTIRVKWVAGQPSTGQWVEWIEEEITDDIHREL